MIPTVETTTGKIDTISGKDANEPLKPADETATDEKDTISWMSVTGFATVAAILLLAGAAVNFGLVVRSRTPAVNVE